MPYHKYENRLFEMSYTAKIIATSFFKLNFEKELASTVKFIIKEYPKTKANYGVTSFQELIEKELSTFQNPKLQFDNLTDEMKVVFWKRVKYIQDILIEKQID